MTNREIITLASKALGVDSKDIAIGNKKNGKTLFISRYDLEDYPNGKEVARYEPGTGKLVIFNVQ